MEETPKSPQRRAGRPRRWESEAEKHRQHRTRRAERSGLVDELLRAVRNARLDDAELHRIAQWEDDAALLRALTAYYQARHWRLSDAKGDPG